MWCDRKGTFSVGNRFGRNCITFGVDMSYCVHVDNNKKWFLILVESPKQGLDGTKFNSEKKAINFIENKKKVSFKLVS